jgi:hypothetical protein
MELASMVEVLYHAKGCRRMQPGSNYADSVSTPESVDRQPGKLCGHQHGVVVVPYHLCVMAPELPSCLVGAVVPRHIMTHHCSQHFESKKRTAFRSGAHAQEHLIINMVSQFANEAAVVAAIRLWFASFLTLPLCARMPKSR